GQKLSHPPVRRKRCSSFVMHTSMPSMPMAHHMPPVQGVPGKAPGVYHGTFHFEMAGEWAIEVRTSTPSRDLMRHKVMIHKKGAQPAMQSDKPHKH
ncbi:FixH family protein, partial [Candidatus Entotheonella palauensis]|uniref:FixH family protein n=1 Tax=Candidatus Entotheonella palauensis TaxID=93172 RepID=UPI001C4E2B63